MKLVPVVLVLACACRATLPPEAARAEAKKIWDERCSNCHGPKGHGDGPGAKLLPVRPRNLADQNWQSDAEDERIAQVIVEGGQVLGLDPNMAANPDLRTKPEIVDALVELVRGL
jgi:mono/diheme cytochrome c family protein